jgi:hypothetical protein
MDKNLLETCIVIRYPWRIDRLKKPGILLELGYPSNLLKNSCNNLLLSKPDARYQLSIGRQTPAQPGSRRAMHRASQSSIPTA